MTRKLVLTALILGLTLGVANAAIITFDPLVGSNADPYFGHMEDGFTVTPGEEWSEAHLFGNSTPSIFGRAEVGVVTVTENSLGTFTFTSVDLADAGDGRFPADFQIQGFLGAALAFNMLGTTTDSFQTIPSAAAGATIDSLRITMIRGLATYNIDNIVLGEGSPAPEPATGLLLGAGLACLGVLRRRRMTD